MKRSRSNPGFSVGVCGAPGSGKTALGCTAPGQLWIQTESNGLGTIHEWSDEVAEIESLNDCLEQLDPSIPLVIPVFPGKEASDKADITSMMKRLDQAVLYVRNHAAEIKAAGRQTVILDSFTDVNQRVIDFEGNENGDQIPMSSWQRIKVRSLRIIEGLRSIVDQGLDLIVIFGIQENFKADPSNKMERVFAGYSPLISGATKDSFQYKLMAVCTISSSSKVTPRGTVTKRSARFVGTDGFHIFKPKGTLGASEEVDFSTWKTKAAERPER